LLKLKKKDRKRNLRSKLKLFFLKASIKNFIGAFFIGVRRYTNRPTFNRIIGVRVNFQ